MRYAERITFVQVEGGSYDPEKGGYVEGETTRETVPCHLSPMSTDRTSQLFGSIEQFITIARLQRPYNKAYDRVEIDDKPFSVRRHVRHRNQSVFFLEGA
ncbi:hypothetical protein EPH95_02705 [Salicibibacter halophilus]|uniref:Uncharacterized protein n=1 Tax=Salicibibacter halophilus TaxID=2502791 RepID=A0A514LED6_9BACI|nr:hypothetical protein [Salicibibacter halophilus]QDI90214.1 hypothetical protein EPH95_02705 [Salicibibacter halophilus]